MEFCDDEFVKCIFVSFSSGYFSWRPEWHTARETAQISFWISQRLILIVVVTFFFVLISNHWVLYSCPTWTMFTVLSAANVYRLQLQIRPRRRAHLLPALLHLLQPRGWEHTRTRCPASAYVVYSAAPSLILTLPSAFVSDRLQTGAADDVRGKQKPAGDDCRNVQGQWAAADTELVSFTGRIV